MRKIARGNGYKGKLDINLRPPVVDMCSAETGDSVMTLFTSPRLASVTVIICYAWFVVGGCYYGLTLAAGQIGTDVYTGNQTKDILQG